MRFTFITIFPEFCQSAMSYGVIGRGVEQGRLACRSVDIRSFALDRYGSVDDAPYGGGPGMVMMAEPIVKAVESLELKPKHKIVLTSPAGRLFDQSVAAEFAGLDEIVFICGRYEGVDERVISCLGAEEFSIGDFVMSGGELAAAVMADSVGRLLDGVLGDSESSREESFSIEGKGLEYPHYTRPREFRGHCVPPVLLEGNHGAIRDWRMQQSLERTRSRRPDLICA
ncbi:MAG: tRNA (guanosine(37)-N1)-methyltransferase TrmD [Planctomycetes bacterium]|nr:tRNA (guanosine(37)-N1)-methyltransferase TrmD [Planctomycetota bacterium]